MREWKELTKICTVWIGFCVSSNQTVSHVIMGTFQKLFPIPPPIREEEEVITEDKS
jgi:hypothetical protein